MCMVSDICTSDLVTVVAFEKSENQIIFKETWLK